MTAAIFDTLAYSKRLKNAGFTEVQAEAQAEAIAEFVTEKLATKDDIHRLELATKSDIQKLESDLHGLEERLTYKLTLRLGAMIAAGITILATLSKLH